MDEYFPQIGFIAHIVKPTERETLHDISPEIKHCIGDHRFPLKTSQQDTLYLAHSSGPHPDPVERLTFLHVGSNEPANLTSFEGSCTSVEFCGHLASANAVFEMVGQLHSLENVSISIGSKQQRFSSENYKVPSTCPSVETLKIFVDKDYFQSFQHDDCYNGCTSEIECVVAAGNCTSRMQKSIILLAEYLLIRSIRSFPNLRHFVWELPKNEVICDAVQSLIQSCPRLQNHANRLNRLNRLQPVPEDAEGNMYMMPEDWYRGRVGRQRLSERRFQEPFDANNLTVEVETSQARSLPIGERDLQQLIQLQRISLSPTPPSELSSVAPLLEGEDFHEHVQGPVENEEASFEELFNLLPEQDVQERLRHWLECMEMYNFFKTNCVTYE